MMKILQIIKIMERFLLLSFLVLVLGFNSGCGSDGTGTGTGGAGGAAGPPEGATAANPSEGFYVKISNPPVSNPDGSSWENAFGDLQEAIKAAAKDSTKKTVYVAQGTYKPTSCPDQANGECAAGDDKDRKKHFALKNGVTVIGGYPGLKDNEYNDMDPSKTFLSGDLGDNDTADETTKTDNVYHVFYHPEAAALTDKAKLENVTITKGNANVPGNANGGGMYNDGSSPTLINVNFDSNKAGYGGGMYNYESSPELTKVTFTGNTAINAGGGMYNYNNSSPELTNVTFTMNIAKSNGGGMYNDGSSPNLTKVTFAENKAYWGGGMYNSNSSPSLTNVTFSRNTATGSGGGMYNTGTSNPKLTDVTFSRNIAGQNGGGMFNISNSSPTFTNICTFTGNKATGNEATATDGKGGAIYDSNDSNPVNLENAKDGGGKEITSITADKGKDNGYYKATQ